MRVALRSFCRGTALFAGIVLIGLAGTVAVADGILPVTLNLKEQESNRFLAQWRVPKQLPASAIPSPLLPDSCRSAGEESITERAGAWLVQQKYNCPDGLSGQVVGMDYPFLNATVSTLLTVELLPGDRYAHILQPGEQGWRIPMSTADDSRRWARDARNAVLAGASHFSGNGLHVLLGLALVLLGGLGVSVRLATSFSAGQLLAVAVSSVTGFQLGAPLAEIGVAVAVALLAREALRPPEERRQLPILAGVAGLVHGLGLMQLVPPSPGYDGSRFLFCGLVVLGMDATLLLAIMAGSGLRRILPRRLTSKGFATAVIYGVGVAAVALALGFPAAVATTDPGERSPGLQIPNLPIPEGASATPASRRVATPFPEAPLQSFVTVAPFEVRHEVLVRLRDLADRIGLEPSADVTIDAQEEIKWRIRDLVDQRAEVVIDGRAVEPADRRVDFLGLDSRGAMPRLVPMPEAVETAWIGVTTVYVTVATPSEVLLTWSGFDTEPVIPATVTDPESSLSVELNRSEPALLWKNELSEDPTPVVSAIAVEPPVLWTPVVSLMIVGFVVAFGVAAVRGRRRALSVALVRIGFASALLLAPFGNVGLPLPASVGATPAPNGARRILSRVLPNVYRAFEYPTESTVYDRLALSVTGDTLTEIYLEHRRAVRM
jgi:hypothetical protein